MRKLLKRINVFNGLKEKLYKVLAPKYVYTVTINGYDEEDDTNFEETLGVYYSSKKAQDRLMSYLDIIVDNEDTEDMHNFIQGIYNEEPDNTQLVTTGDITISIMKEKVEL